MILIESCSEDIGIPKCNTEMLVSLQQPKAQENDMQCGDNRLPNQVRNMHTTSEK